jgi:HAE1 family hydrophobic/amphiphilic exporter-1
MVPMMLMSGEGSAMFSPMGTAVVFGLTVSTLITLILVPSVYSLVDSILVKLHLR